ncbi:MAG: hypothetical protein AB7P03_16440 [Kofleriaceae bacterium]
MTRTTLLVAIGLAVGLAATAEARPRPAGRTRSFQANKTFGLGLELGAPTGINGKYFLSDNGALDFGVGTIYRWRQRDGLHLYLDYLFHPVSLTSNPTFELPLYFGIGGRVWDFTDDRRDQFDDPFAFGIRVPGGIAMDFNNVPVDIWFQLVFVLDFYTNYYRSAYADINGSIGIRYWFK